MKKLVLVVLFMVMILSGCNQNQEPDYNGVYYQLPDLNGYRLDEIEDLFTSRNRSYEIVYETVEDEAYELQFIMYMNFDTGDLINSEQTVIIKVYPPFTGERTLVRLPSLDGLTQSEIEAYFEGYGVSLSFSDSIEVNNELAGTFYAYSSGYEAGDIFYLNSALGIILYKGQIDLTRYFFPIEMEYDGPLLDESYRDIDPIDPRGGYFEVTLQRCGDGDTAVFNYPQEVYDAIISDAKSARFLNMDTEETFSGGEEEWGKPGSVYTCSLLESAESIIIQTDPNDALTGTYGRLLSWIWIQLPGEEDYHLLNYMVVKQGLAQVKYDNRAGKTLVYGEYTYNEWMHMAEDYAQVHELGQWGDLLDYYWDYVNDAPNYFRWYND